MVTPGWSGSPLAARPELLPFSSTHGQYRVILKLPSEVHFSFSNESSIVMGEDKIPDVTLFKMLSLLPIVAVPVVVVAALSVDVRVEAFVVDLPILEVSS